MQEDGFPSARVSPEQKETFSQQILRFVCPHSGSCVPHDVVGLTPSVWPHASFLLHFCPLPPS